MQVQFWMKEKMQNFLGKHSLSIRQSKNLNTDKKCGGHPITGWPPIIIKQLLFSYYYLYSFLLYTFLDRLRNSCISNQDINTGKIAYLAISRLAYLR